MYNVQKEQLNMKVIRILCSCMLCYMIPVMLILLVLPASPLVFVNNLSMVLLALAYEVLQNRVRNFFWYSVGHMVCLWLLFAFSPTGGEALIRLGTGMIAAVVVYVARLRQKRVVYPGWPLLFLGLLMGWTGAYIGSRPLGYLAFGTEAVSMILVLLYWNGRSMASALAQSPDRSRVPEEKIRRANQILAAGWATLAGVLVLIVTVFAFGRQILLLVGEGLRFVAQKLLEFLLFVLSLLPEFNPSLLGLGDRAYPFFANQGTLHPVLAVVLEILQAAFFVLLFYWLLKGLLRFFRNVYGEFVTADVGEVHERVFREPHGEEKTIEKAAAKKRGLRLSPSSEIRERYRRLIRKSPNRKAVRRYQTPHEIETVAAGGVPEQVHRLYEKARYAPETCTGGDAAAMRQALAERQRDGSSVLTKEPSPYPDPGKWGGYEQ